VEICMLDAADANTVDERPPTEAKAS
jgi:hypothetical protein